MEYYYIYMSLAIVLGLFMAWGIGANDVANAMGAAVGSRSITILQAILIASVFEFSGSILAGSAVTDTIRGQIIEPGAFTDHMLFVRCMLSALFAASVWLLVASYKGWPVSTTHTIVGAIVGAGSVGVSVDVVYWGKVVQIALSWVVTPMISGVIAALLYKSVRKFILEQEDTHAKAKQFIPYYIGLMFWVIASITLTKGLKHLRLPLNYFESIGLALLISIMVTLLVVVFMSAQARFGTKESDKPRKSVERYFAIFMIFTASAMAFAHGSNDVANSIGPLAAIIGVLKSGSMVMQTDIPLWVLFLGAAGIVLGLATYGYRVIKTVGSGITRLTPSRAFSAEIATASTVVIASGIGLPVSTTQTLIGAILGVGMTSGVKNLNLSMTRKIFMSWVITLPVGAGLAIMFYYILKLL